MIEEKDLPGFHVMCKNKEAAQRASVMYPSLFVFYREGGVIKSYKNQWPIDKK